MRLIDADAFRERMYHEAFETDTDLQKWDSGCWIRYKMFETAIEAAKPIDAVPVVRCRECIYRKPWAMNTTNYFDSEVKYYCDINGIFVTDGFYCADGGRRE